MFTFTFTQVSSAKSVLFAYQASAMLQCANLLGNTFDSNSDSLLLMQKKVLSLYF